jgi:N12 class adenine-specific DNA methylase
VESGTLACSVVADKVSIRIVRPPYFYSNIVADGSRDATDAYLIGVHRTTIFVPQIYLRTGLPVGVFLASRLYEWSDIYAARYGPINRFKLARSGRVDPDTGEEITRRVNPPMGGFRDDPDFYSVAALEVYDPETGTASKAPIFTAPVIGPRHSPQGADSAADALALVLNERARVDVGRVAELLGVDEDTARAELGGLVWEDPDSGELVAAARYLSGNVREKLEAAQRAAEGDPRFEANVTALRQALPDDLGPGEIAVRLGVPWVGSNDVAVFVGEVLGVERAVVEHTPRSGLWSITAPTHLRRSVRSTVEWGTDRVDAVALVQASLEQRPIKVYADPLADPDGFLAGMERYAKLGIDAVWLSAPAADPAGWVERVADRVGPRLADL